MAETQKSPLQASWADGYLEGAGARRRMGDRLRAEEWWGGYRYGIGAVKRRTAAEAD